MAPIASQSEAVFITNCARQQPTYHRRDLRILGSAGALAWVPLIRCEHIINLMFVLAMKILMRRQGRPNEREPQHLLIRLKAILGKKKKSKIIYMFL